MFSIFVNRYRGPPPQMSHQRSMAGEGDEGQKRPPIVSDKAITQFDEILRKDGTNDGGGWAGPQGEIDYRYGLFKLQWMNMDI